MNVLERPQDKHTITYQLTHTSIVLNFTSIRELGEYLQYLDKNDTAYNEYFKWLKTYFIKQQPDISVTLYTIIHCYYIYDHFH